MRCRCSLHATAPSLPVCVVVLLLLSAVTAVVDSSPLKFHLTSSLDDNVDGLPPRSRPAMDLNPRSPDESAAAAADGSRRQSGVLIRPRPYDDLQEANDVHVDVQLTLRLHAPLSHLIAGFSRRRPDRFPYPSAAAAAAGTEVEDAVAGDSVDGSAPVISITNTIARAVQSRLTDVSGESTWLKSDEKIGTRNDEATDEDQEREKEENEEDGMRSQYRGVMIRDRNEAAAAAADPTDGNADETANDSGWITVDVDAKNSTQVEDGLLAAWLLGHIVDVD